MSKRIIFLVLAILLFPIHISADWRVEKSLYKFDFDNSIIPRYSIISGDWDIENPFSIEKINIDFDDEESPLFIKRGIWEIKDGKYIQSEEGMSSTARSIINKEYEDFEISLDVTPKSDENTLMIYFGYENEGDYSSIEINSYQSKLILDGMEYFGEGGISKDKTYHVKLTVEDSTISLFCDGEIIFQKELEKEIKGKVGIGTWNSKMEYDNIELFEIPQFGKADKLIGRGYSEGILFFDEITVDNFEFTSKLAIDNIFKGKVGLVVRADENKNGYYVIIDKSSVYILKIENGEKKVLKREEFKPRSNKFYEISVLCDDEEISVLIDGVEVLNVKDKTFKSGKCGFYKDMAEAYFEYLDIKALKNVMPPVISKGNTTYYLNSQNGNDNNDGISENTAWKTIDKINQTTFKSGDKLVLNGDFSGTIVLENIICDIENPLIISGGNITASDAVISIKNCENIIVSDCTLNLRHFGKLNNLQIGKGYGVKLENSKKIVLSSCKINGSGVDTDTIAIEFEDDYSYTNCEIKDVEMNNFYINNICINNRPVNERADTDDTKSHWAYKYLKNLQNKGIINEFRPDDKVTRAEFSTMLVAAMGLEETEYRGIFRDINSDMWYAKKIQTVSDYRLLPNEMTIDLYALPNSELKRCEAAAMTTLSLNLGFDNEVLYNDIELTDEWCIKYVKSILASGVMVGKENGSFCPNDSITRGEAAVILTKMMDFAEEK